MRAWKKGSKVEAEGTAGVVAVPWGQTSSVFPSGMPLRKQKHWRGSPACKILHPPCGRISEVSREAEVLLSADVQLTRGRKRSKRRLLLFQEELVVAKLQGGTTLRPQLCLALDQLWVFSCGKEEVREQEEKEGGSKEDGTSLLFSWPRGSCIVDFGSQELKELWLGTLRGTPEGARGGRVNLLPSVQLLEKELSHHHAWKTLSARSLEMLVEGQAEADPKQGHAPGPPSNGRGLCHALAGGSSSRRKGLPCPLALQQSPPPAQVAGQVGSGCSTALFGQPLAALCGEDGRLPQPLQELLAVLQQAGPMAEGIFRRADSATALQELREALDRGEDIDMARQPALLLAVVLKDFLRSIPSKLLVNNLYEDWMAAMQKTSREEKVEELKAVADKLPGANLLFLKQLLSLLRCIGHNAATSKMTYSNLAICVGPNLLSPPNEDGLPLEAMLEVTEKVKGLVEFLIENFRDVFEEETTALFCAAAKEGPAPTERYSDVPLEEPRVPTGRAETEHQAEALSPIPPSLLRVLKEVGEDMVVEPNTGEAPRALSPATPETTPEISPEITPETVPDMTPETVSETTPETVPETTPETVPETTPETVPVTSLEIIPETMPEITPEITPGTVPEITPETTPGTVPEITPVITPETTLEITPDTVPETTPEITPEITPQAMPVITPETTPEITPDTVPETTPETTPETMPVTSLETTPDSLARGEEIKSSSEEERRFAGCQQENEKRNRRKRKVAWTEEREWQREMKRRKTEESCKFKEAGVLLLLPVEVL